MDDLSPDPSPDVTTAVPDADRAWPFPRRLVAVFTSPRALFEHLAHRPTWLVPLIVYVVAILAVFFVLWDPVIMPEQIAKLEESGQMNDQAMMMMSGPGKYFVFAFGTVFAVVQILVWALAVFLVAGFLLGGTLSFRQALSIISHASLVAIPGALVRIPLALASGSSQVTVGPGAFFPVATAEGFFQKFLANVLTNLDLFLLWEVALVTLGTAIVSRLPFARAALGVWSLYVLFVLLASLLGAAFQK
jgi:hypothetical protein